MRYYRYALPNADIKDLVAGLVQAIFTVSVLVFFIPIYYNFYLSFLWQVGLTSCNSLAHNMENVLWA